MYVCVCNMNSSLFQTIFSFFLRKTIFSFVPLKKKKRLLYKDYFLHSGNGMDDQTCDL